MGSYQGTCIFTRTAIDLGEPILIVIYTGDLKGISTYSAHQEFFHYKRRLAELSEYFARHNAETNPEFKAYAATSNYHKYMENELAELKLPFVVLRGKYNDYGWIENDPSEQLDYDACKHFLIHEFVARDICITEKADYNNDLELLDALFGYAHVCRTQLFGDLLLGAQWDSIAEIRKQEHLHKLTKQALQMRRRDLKDVS